MRVNAGAPFGEVSMTVRNNESGTVQTISSITLQVGGKSISIPEKAYSNLGAALLNTVELMKPDGDGALYISFETQFRASDGQSLRRIVRLTYRDGRIESRMIGTRSSDYDGKGEGSTSWTNEKL